MPHGVASAVGVCLGIGDVLSACRIHPRHLGDWNITKLDELPNLRGSRPIPHCHNTRYQGLTDKELYCLRSRERVCLDLSRDNTKKAGIPTGTQVVQRNTSLTFTRQDWARWLELVLEQEEEVTERVFNVLMGSIVSESTRRELPISVE